MDQIRGKGSKLPGKATASPQGVGTPISATAAQVGWLAQDEQEKGTTKPTMAENTSEGSSAQASPAFVRYRFGRDAGSRYWHGWVIFLSVLTPY